MMKMRREILFLSSFFCIAILNAADKAPKLKTIEDIPAFCTAVAERLDQAPIFKGLGSPSHSSKLLCLDDWNDCRICDMLSVNAQQKIRPDAWSINQFGFGQRSFYGKDLGCGIELDLWISEKQGRCTLQELNQAYSAVMAMLKKGWEKASRKDYPNMMFKKPKKKWCLFIKTSKLIDELDLIDFLSLKFGISEFIAANDAWLKPNGGYELTNKIYLWIKADKFDEVQKIFGFQIS
jgi:hypothetical protein